MKYSTLIPAILAGSLAGAIAVFLIRRSKKANKPAAAAIHQFDHGHTAALNAMHKTMQRAAMKKTTNAG